MIITFENFFAMVWRSRKGRKRLWMFSDDEYKNYEHESNSILSENSDESKNEDIRNDERVVLTF